MEVAVVGNCEAIVTYNKRDFGRTAVAEKVSALMTLDYLQVRAARGSRDKFEAVLAKVADREPPGYDALPDKK